MTDKMLTIGELQQLAALIPKLPDVITAAHRLAEAARLVLPQGERGLSRTALLRLRIAQWDALFPDTLPSQRMK